MDVLVEITDEFVLQPLLYSSISADWAQESNIYRQTLSLFLLLWIGGMLMYLSVASLSYVYFTWMNGEYFFGTREKQPKIRKELCRALTSIPLMSAVTTPCVLPEVRGFSRLYSNIDDYGVPYLIFSLVWFLIFTDCFVYWIHRGLHQGWFYRYIHKDHHAYVDVMSPFASHAFHPLDGWAQSLPYHIFVYLFPIHKWAYVGMFIFVNMWTISIHDMVYLTHWKFVNGAAHHTIHHSDFLYNYGQYFTFWDRVCGTHKPPPVEHLNGEYRSRTKKLD